MDKPSIYLETSLISYAAGRISRDLKIAALQESAQEWWDNYRYKYELYISLLVIQESRSGNTKAAEEREKLLLEAEF